MHLWHVFAFYNQCRSQQLIALDLRGENLVIHAIEHQTVLPHRQYLAIFLVRIERDPSAVHQIIEC